MFLSISYIVSFLQTPLSVHNSLTLPYPIVIIHPSSSSSPPLLFFSFAARCLPNCSKIHGSVNVQVCINHHVHITIVVFHVK
jgi:hypothetical protein